MPSKPHAMKRDSKPAEIACARLPKSFVWLPFA